MCYAVAALCACFRYWALSLPVLLLVVLAVVFFGYVLINMLYSPPPDDMRQFTGKGNKNATERTSRKHRQYTVKFKELERQLHLP